ncbi:sterol desaturase family protein [Paucibacter sp. B51]|uniref:sterol desaturase family protein n=1 Tax=Paucibacter sp. B51 TaxID=2993315 RepID=UPI0022EBC887|nr:sterol desaturase family protein [Paucibacter sp. B51]
MPLITLRQSRRACLADLAFYALAIAGLAAALWLNAAAPSWQPQSAARVLGLFLLGLLLWSLLEYLTHRFVLHGLQPFQRWHALHHALPQAHVGLPTWLSASLFATLVFAPLYLLLGGVWSTLVMLGVLSGYLVYSAIHHAVHQGLAAERAPGDWLARRARWHALHHQGGASRCYGVSSSFWDRALGSHLRARGSAPAGSAPPKPAAPEARHSAAVRQRTDP